MGRSLAAIRCNSGRGEVASFNRTYRLLTVVWAASEPPVLCTATYWNPLMHCSVFRRYSQNYVLHGRSRLFVKGQSLPRVYFLAI
jgi:hypothetical protein